MESQKKRKTKIPATHMGLLTFKSVEVLTLTSADPEPWWSYARLGNTNITSRRCILGVYWRY